MNLDIMINLSAYDNVKIEHDTWIDSKYKRFYSKSIPYRPFFTILKRFNPDLNRTEFYLVLMDEHIDGRVCKPVARSPKGFIKINLGIFWDSLGVGNIGVAEIEYSTVEVADNAIIYYIDI